MALHDIELIHIEAFFFKVVKTSMLTVRKLNSHKRLTSLEHFQGTVLTY